MESNSENFRVSGLLMKASRDRDAKLHHVEPRLVLVEVHFAQQPQGTTAFLHLCI